MPIDWTAFRRCHSKPLTSQRSAIDLCPTALICSCSGAAMLPRICHCPTCHMQIECIRNTDSTQDPVRSKRQYVADLMGNGRNREQAHGSQGECLIAHRYSPFMQICWQCTLWRIMCSIPGMEASDWVNRTAALRSSGLRFLGICGGGLKVPCPGLYAEARPAGPSGTASNRQIVVGAPARPYRNKNV